MLFISYSHYVNCQLSMQSNANNIPIPVEKYNSLNAYGVSNVVNFFYYYKDMSWSRIL